MSIKIIDIPNLFIFDFIVHVKYFPEKNPLTSARQLGVHKYKLVSGLSPHTCI